ncbi:hypothetical protein TNCT_291771 [Trichonephila clavata]|uniref:Uncharacterized protein n=1 Tax=Trichonephila clavata TaxID=2740835 RepID=A0A8X6HTV9_TRICU|nr:hypothetical protein TNCT_291771 [Trichonephila clavata]
MDTNGYYYADIVRKYYHAKKSGSIKGTKWSLDKVKDSNKNVWCGYAVVAVELFLGPPPSRNATTDEVSANCLGANHRCHT